MRRSLLLLLLVLVQLLTSNLVGAKEDVSNSEKETKTSEKSEKEEEEEEDSCLSSPCGSHARCKNVQVCQIIFAPKCFVPNTEKDMKKQVLWKHVGPQIISLGRAK